MKTTNEILEEIARCAPPDLQGKIAEIMKREKHTPEQEKAIDNAWEGLLFVRRCHMEELVRAYENC